MSHLIEVSNPATGEKIGEVKGISVKEGVEAIARAKKAQELWAKKPLAQRVKVIQRFNKALIDKADDFCQAITLENGKPLMEAMITEVLPVVDITDYFCGHAAEILAKQPISMHRLKYRKSYIHFKPRGVVFVISPWNFPFVIPVGEVIMSLIAGNAVIQKPASLTPLIALKTRELMLEIGLDPNLYQVLPMKGEDAFKLIGAGVDYVNFTGSVATGEKVSAECGKHLIPCTMELGGKDPAIVCEDVNIGHAARCIAWGAFANAGQVCASVERVYVHESIYQKFVDKVVEVVKEMKIGDPFEDGISMGPMKDPHQLKIVADHIDNARNNGAVILTGGYKIDGPGLFYAPTVLVDVNDDMECVKEETFGPTMPIMKYSDIDEAVRRANDSPYGLNAYVFTADRYKGQRIAEKLQAGTVMVNEVLITYGLPETPWGGVKKSGVGRVHGDDGLRELCIQYHVNYDLPYQIPWSPFRYPYTHKKYRIFLNSLKTLWGQGIGAKLSGIRGLFK
jgi:acyl-CoA reductase-like NAD-dependent aldehyde dehydrogenase